MEQIALPFILAAGSVYAPRSQSPLLESGRLFVGGCGSTSLLIIACKSFGVPVLIASPALALGVAATAVGTYKFGRGFYDFFKVQYQPIVHEE